MEHSTTHDFSHHVTATHGVDGAVGVPKTHWYVAIVNNRAEKKTAELMSLSHHRGAYECYVPTQQEERVWKNGKKKVIDRIVLPAMLLVRCTEAARLDSLRQHLVNRYMVDRTRTTNGHYAIATIPDEQIQQLRQMISGAEAPVVIENIHYHLGDKVKVKEGPLAGFIANVIEEPTATYLTLRLNTLGFAKLQINPDSVEKVE